MQSETKFKNRIRPHLEAIRNCFVIKIQQVAVGGDPDFVLCIGGLYVGMELKRDLKSKPTKLQIYKLQKIEKAGGVAIVVAPETWDVAYAYLKALSEIETVLPLRIPSCLKSVMKV